MLETADLNALYLTLKLACITTLILLLLGTPLAWWLARTRWRFSFIIETLIALPLVLPPTVLGFYLLLALGPNGFIGNLLQAAGATPWAFTFKGLVLGSVIYSLPFVIQPLQDSFKNISGQLLDVAATLRASPLDSFISVVLPMAKSGFITASMLAFAHTLGEFGVVLMLGGNIPGETQVLSIALYDHVESLEYAQAHWLAGFMLLLSFGLLLLVYGTRGHFRLSRS